MSCEEAYEWMQRDLDGELDDAEKEELLRHYTSCPACALLYERLHSLSTYLEQLPIVEPPFSIVQSILPQLDEIDRTRQLSPSDREQVASVEVLPKKKKRAIWYRYIGTATAAGLLISAIIFTLDQTTMKQSLLETNVQSLTKENPGISTAMKAKEERTEPQQEKDIQQGGQKIALRSPASDKAEVNTAAFGESSALGHSLAEKRQNSGNLSDSLSSAKQTKAHEATPQAGPKRDSTPQVSLAQPNSEAQAEVAKADEPREDAEPRQEVAIAKATEPQEDNKTFAAKSSEASSLKKDATTEHPPMLMGEKKVAIAEGQAQEKEGTGANNAYKPPGKPSPSREFFVSKNGNRLLVRDGTGHIEFVTHTWPDVYNVSYYWINDKQILYKLEYISRPGTEDAPVPEPQEWLIDLEKNIEHPIFNK